MVYAIPYHKDVGGAVSSRSLSAPIQVLSPIRQDSSRLLPSVPSTQLRLLPSVWNLRTFPPAARFVRRGRLACLADSAGVRRKLASPLPRRCSTHQTQTLPSSVLAKGFSFH